MMTIREYKRVESLEEAWELNQKKANRVIGGMIWLKMSRGNVGTAIDISGLGLDQIEETEDAFEIGAMVTLRQLEEHPGLAAYTDGAMRESVRHIVGVQLRNLATVGGSIYGRFGFSDVLTMFLAMDTEVELYKAGRNLSGLLARQKAAAALLQLAAEELGIVVHRHRRRAAHSAAGIDVGVNFVGGDVLAVYQRLAVPDDVQGGDADVVFFNKLRGQITGAVSGYSNIHD